MREVRERSSNGMQSSILSNDRRLVANLGVGRIRCYVITCTFQNTRTVIATNECWLAVFEYDPPVRAIAFVMNFLRRFEANVQQVFSFTFFWCDLFVRWNFLVGGELDRCVHEIIKAAIVSIGFFPIFAAVFADPAVTSQSDLSFRPIDRFNRKIEVVPGNNSGNIHLFIAFNAGIDPPSPVF